MMVRFVFFISILCLPFCLLAQNKIDVLDYYFKIELNDNNDTIKCWAEIQFVALENSSAVDLDLTGVNNKGKGMKVTHITSSSRGSALPPFTQQADKLTIQWPRELKKGDTAKIVVGYHGIPGDGLIISKNKFDKRTFFADNWPNRAHYWLLCNDKPIDKASVTFSITAPAHYKVVSNGVLIDETALIGNKKMTRWKETVPLPTKIMVIGVADFAVDSVGETNGIPVSSWVFSENKKDGFYDYAPAKEILAWHINYIGPFPYKKLANVQSKTIFGGMENAGAIFYYENSVSGKRKEESLLSHEIVHQWFGDMATEKSFPHLWLSEGFATYLTHIFIESKYGTDSMNKEMKADRQVVIDFDKESSLPVVDSTSSLMGLLNANSYQKGGWILHMLRRQLGDSVFHRIIRSYYATYAGKNADTRDFQKICETVSGKKLETFFDQWLYTPGQPNLDVKWNYDMKSKNVILTVTQLQKSIFQFPLDIQLQAASGKSQWQTLEVIKQTQEFKIPVKEETKTIYLDPKTSLLFKGSVSAN